MLNSRIWHLGSFWVMLIDLYCCVGVMLRIMNKLMQRNVPCFFTAENNGVLVYVFFLFFFIKKKRILMINLDFFFLFHFCFLFFPSFLK